MENASKALIMAGGILIGILILTLMITLTMSTQDFSTTYENQKKQEAIQQFNTNFTKDVGQDLTIHDVVTICNFTKLANNGTAEVTIEGTKYNETHIGNDIKVANEKLLALQEESQEYYKVEIVYSLKILDFDEQTGHISKIEINKNNKFKCYKKVENETTDKIEIDIEYKN